MGTNATLFELTRTSIPLQHHRDWQMFNPVIPRSEFDTYSTSSWSSVFLHINEFKPNDHPRVHVAFPARVE